MSQIFFGKGKIFGKGVYANTDFKKGEIVIQYNLKKLSEDEFNSLQRKERYFVHTHYGIKYLYSIPERYVNHSSDPNTVQDLKNHCDIALRDIQKGEQIITNALKDNI